MPSAPDSTTNSCGLPSSCGADDEQLGVGAAHDTGLHAVEHVAVAARLGRGGRGDRVEQRRRLGERQRGGRDLVTGEGGQVGRLLLVGAPQGRARSRPRPAPAPRRPDPCRPWPGPRAPGCRPWRSARWRCRRAPRARRGSAGRSRGWPSSSVVGRGARLVGVGGGRTHHLVGELPHHVGEHLLVLAGREVEHAGVLRRRDPVARGWTSRRGRRCDRRCPRCGSPALVTR